MTDLENRRRLEMNADIELGIVNAYSELCLEIEPTLRDFRNACKSDEEFSSRMTVESRNSNPLINQYYFDDLPVLYTILEFTDTGIRYSAGKGLFQH